MVDFIQKDCYNIKDLIDIIRLLREPGGCPWDAKQTHESIKKNLIEETYEVIEAVNKDDKELLCEELGDLLMQVVFHAQMETEAGVFNFDDVADGVCKKLVERHPHVFGEITVSGVEDVLTNWDAIKQNSKKRETVKEQLDGVCKALPALMLASKYVSKSMKNGVEFSTPAIDGEVTEEMIGETLFDVVALAKKHGVDPELALKEKCKKYLENM